MLGVVCWVLVCYTLLAGCCPPSIIIATCHCELFARARCGSLDGAWPVFSKAACSIHPHPPPPCPLLTLHPPLPPNSPIDSQTT